MPLWKSVGSTVALTLVNLNVATCRSPGESGGGQDTASKEEPKTVKLEGVDTSALTAREQKDWSTYVSELLAPCPDQPVSLAQCVKEARPCSLCVPAAKFLSERVTRGGTRSQVESAFRIRFAADTVKTVDEGDSPSKGAKDAAVVIVEWADFQCPYCGAAAPVIDKLPEKYPGHVRVVFKNYPLASHQNSEVAARASVSAGKQGKFWEMHHALFSNQQSGLDRGVILNLAKELGLDEKKFVAELDAESTADSVNRDRKQAEKLGLRGTPMIYVNGRNFEIEQFNLLEDLGPWIELEVEQRTGQKVTPKKVDGGGFEPPGEGKPEVAVKKPAPAASSSGAPKKAP
jgi:predicted DsbA family dithiol-disulfide isomerase